MTDRRRLIVMRHAKAENFADTDHERTLTDRGRADAEAAGARLREDGLGLSAKGKRDLSLAAADRACRGG